MSHELRQGIKRLVGPRWTTRLRCLTRGLDIPQWGNLRRVRPFSEYFGFDRGTPIDRYYLDKFLRANRGQVRGDVLEIQESSHTHRYGSNLRRTDSVDINPMNNPTFVCDLAHSEGVISSESYDCFLLPNTLSFLRDIDGCLKEALRVVRPGGIILATTASFVPLARDCPDYWRLSSAGWQEITRRAWPGCEVNVEAYGNCLAAVAAMLGLAVEELTPAELDTSDPRYPVLVALVCRKPFSVGSK